MLRIAHITNKSALKNTIKPAPTTVEALVSPQKSIGSKINSLTDAKYSRHSTRQSLHYAEYKQMGDKNGYPDNMNHRLNSQQRLDSSNKQRSFLRNNGKNVMSTMASQGMNEYNDKEVDLQQVPVKVFEMHGNVRSLAKNEELQNSTYYRKGDEYRNGKSSHQQIRTTSKRLKSRDKNTTRKQTKVSGSMTQPKSETHKMKNNLYSQSMPLKNDMSYKQK